MNNYRQFKCSLSVLYDIPSLLVRKILLMLFTILTIFQFSYVMLCFQQHTNSTELRRNLEDLVNEFTSDEGESGQNAWHKLLSFNHAELVDTLKKIRSKLNVDNSLTIRISFVLCVLNEDYELNKNYLTSALHKGTDFKNIGVEDIEWLISRLINRGDKKLLQTLFPVTAWSDGALSEALNSTFKREIYKCPDRFLSEISKASRKDRASLYKFIKTSQGTELEIDLNPIREYLKKVDRHSALYAVAKEMLGETSANR
jgi:hypothetical protein